MMNFRGAVLTFSKKRSRMPVSIGTLILFSLLFGHRQELSPLLGIAVHKCVDMWSTLSSHLNCSDSATAGHLQTYVSNLTFANAAQNHAGLSLAMKVGAIHGALTLVASCTQYA